MLLPQGGWEGMGGDATSRWVGGAATSLGGVVVLEQPSLSSSCLSCPERVSGPGHSAAERQRLPRVPHLRGACESPTAEGHVHLQRQSPAAACPSAVSPSLPPQLEYSVCVCC